MLRHYYELGLLELVDVDLDSGYRRYATEQIVTAQVIRRFRDLDMPLWRPHRPGQGRGARRGRIPQAERIARPLSHRAAAERRRPAQPRARHAPVTRCPLPAWFRHLRPQAAEPSTPGGTAALV
jgi:DNA-binding transcriptional MerR regulator